MGTEAFQRELITLVDVHSKRKRNSTQLNSTYLNSTQAKIWTFQDIARVRTIQSFSFLNKWDQGISKGVNSDVRRA